uniref:Mr_precursor_128 n=1 Tax=Conus marmoreus TaxID=42752 RepID=U6C2D4_CONMR|nr:Mr_precursor_128 [Conus marmoreus]
MSGHTSVNFLLLSIVALGMVATKRATYFENQWVADQLICKKIPSYAT